MDRFWKKSCDFRYEKKKLSTPAQSSSSNWLLSLLLLFDLVVPMVDISDSLLFEVSAICAGCWPDVDGNDAISSIGGNGSLLGVVTRRFNETSTGYLSSESKYIRRDSSFLSSWMTLMPVVCECLIWRCSFNDNMVTLME